LPSRLRKPTSPRPRKRAAADGDGSDRRSKDWLNTARWQRLRLKVLERDEYICQQTGVALVDGKKDPHSAVVDHKIPHRGNPELFWDERNLQSVCKRWHDSVKQSMERRGLV